MFQIFDSAFLFEGKRNSAEIPAETLAQIRKFFPLDIPLIANLRCGLWYAKQWTTTCYFKVLGDNSSGRIFAEPAFYSQLMDIATIGNLI